MPRAHGQKGRKEQHAPLAERWRSRIVGHGEEKADQLLANPGNWRIHPIGQQQALGALLDQVGWVQDVVVNRKTGHVVDGHLRVHLALERNETVPIVYVELSEEEERLVLASLDPLTGMAVIDDAKMLDLLDGLKADGALGSLLEELADGLNPATDRVAANDGDNTRDLGDRARLVKAVLYVTEIDVVERALLKTMQPDRGSAFLAVCRAYLGE